MLSFVKTCVAVCAMALTLSRRTGVLPNVQFSNIAMWDLGRENIAQNMDELLRDRAPRLDAGVSPPRTPVGSTNPVHS